eukprot:INCI7201.9.p1 GENE.INCI7201.9~~INCI7201.9.p1  ORF type:complete len:917 (-),score=173.09 INCI7201.9:2196-4580(-)
MPQGEAGGLDNAEDSDAYSESGFGEQGNLHSPDRDAGDDYSADEGGEGGFDDSLPFEPAGSSAATVRHPSGAADTIATRGRSSESKSASGSVGWLSNRVLLSDGYMARCRARKEVVVRSLIAGFHGIHALARKSKAVNGPVSHWQFKVYAAPAEVHTAGSRKTSVVLRHKTLVFESGVIESRPSETESLRTPRDNDDFAESTADNGDFFDDSVIQNAVDDLHEDVLPVPVTSGGFSFMYAAAGVPVAMSEATSSAGHKPLDIIITLCAVSATGGSPTDATIRRAVGMPRTSSAVHSKRWVQRPVADAVLPTTVNAAAGKMRGVYSVTPESDLVAPAGNPDGYPESMQDVPLVARGSSGSNKKTMATLRIAVNVVVKDPPGTNRPAPPLDLRETKLRNADTRKPLAITASAAARYDEDDGGENRAANGDAGAALEVVDGVKSAFFAEPPPTSVATRGTARSGASTRRRGATTRQGNPKAKAKGNSKGNNHRISAVVVSEQDQLVKRHRSNVRRQAAKNKQREQDRLKTLNRRVQSRVKSAGSKINNTLHPRFDKSPTQQAAADAAAAKIAAARKRLLNPKAKEEELTRVYQQLVAEIHDLKQTLQRRQNTLRTWKRRIRLTTQQVALEKMFQKDTERPMRATPSALNNMYSRYNGKSSYQHFMDIVSGAPDDLPASKEHADPEALRKKICTAERAEERSQWCCDSVLEVTAEAGFQAGNTSKIGRPCGVCKITRGLGDNGRAPAQGSARKAIEGAYWCGFPDGEFEETLRSPAQRARTNLQYRRVQADAGAGYAQ